MNIELPSDYGKFVKGLVAQGRFQSEEDVVTEGIRLLMSNERLRAEIQRGVQQIDAGDCFNEEDVFAEIESEIDRIDSLRQES